MENAIAKYQLNQSGSDEEDLDAEQREKQQEEAANQIIKEIL